MSWSQANWQRLYREATMTELARHTEIPDTAPSEARLACDPPEFLDADWQVPNNLPLRVSAETVSSAGHAAVRSFDQLAEDLGLPLLDEHETMPNERRTSRFVPTIGETSVGSYEACLEELARPLPTLEFTPEMPEPPVAEWADRRKRLDQELDAQLSMLDRRSPWQRQAYDRRKSWGEIGQSFRGLIPFRHRPQSEATFGMALDSAAYLIEAYSTPLTRAVADAPYAFSAWGDQQLTRFENVLYGFGGMIRSGARHVGETHTWQYLKQAASSRPADFVISYTLLAASMAAAVGQDFVKHPINTTGFLVSLPFVSAWSGAKATVRAGRDLARGSAGLVGNIANSPLGDAAAMAGAIGEVISDAPWYYAGRLLDRLTPPIIKRGLRAAHRHVYDINGLTRRAIPEPYGYELERHVLTLIDDIRARRQLTPEGPSKLPQRWAAPVGLETEKGSLNVRARLADLGELTDDETDNEGSLQQLEDSNDPHEDGTIGAASVLAPIAESAHSAQDNVVAAFDLDDQGHATQSAHTSTEPHDPWAETAPLDGPTPTPEYAPGVREAFEEQQQRSSQALRDHLQELRSLAEAQPPTAQERSGLTRKTSGSSAGYRAS